MINKRKMTRWLVLLVEAFMTLMALSCKNGHIKDESLVRADFNAHSSSVVRLLTTAEFQQEVLDYRQRSDGQSIPSIKLQRPAVIDFYADWCEPCRESSPMFDRLALRFADYADFYRVNVDEEPELYAITGQTSIPLFLFLWPSGVATYRVGFGEHTEEEMIKLIERHIVQGEALMPTI
jgi:thioredoxin 1